jgi:hypothetical protein
MIKELLSQLIRQTFAFGPFSTCANNSFTPPLKTAPWLQIFGASSDLFLIWITCPLEIREVFRNSMGVPDCSARPLSDVLQKYNSFLVCDESPNRPCLPFYHKEPEICPEHVQKVGGRAGNISKRRCCRRGIGQRPSRIYSQRE